MSGSSIISLIIFLSLVAFAVTGSMFAMLISAAIMCATWYWYNAKHMNPHFTKLMGANADYSDDEFLREIHLPRDHGVLLLATLRRQLPKTARAIPLRPDNDLWVDLNLDPVSFELDDVSNLCDQLGLDFRIDPEIALYEQVHTIRDLAEYISK